MSSQHVRFEANPDTSVAYERTVIERTVAGVSEHVEVDRTCWDFGVTPGADGFSSPRPSCSLSPIKLWRLAMRWILTCALTFTYGCGDADPVSTEITAGYAPQQNIIKPIDAAEATLEYTLTCQGREDLEGDFGPGEPGPIDDDRVFVWTTSPLDLPPGPCSVVLRMRDAEREVICTAYEDFVVAMEEPTEVDVLMGCELTPY